jgi:signal transduction histidine kinase/ActR/RegA family two-component response regulator
MEGEMAGDAHLSAAGGATGGDVRRRLATQEQFDATNEVLLALGRNSTDPDAVLGTIVDSARRLCRADTGQLYRLDGTQLSLAKAVGMPDDVVEYLTANPIMLDRRGLIGRVCIARETAQIVDVLADPDYGLFDLQRLAGFRTTIGSPLLLDDEVVGVLSLWRNEVEAFDDAAVAVLETFSAQAAIAVRTIDLVAALESRGAELTRRVEQLQALAEVGEAITSSLDLDEVLQTIVMNAVRMAGADGGSIMQYVEDDRSFSVRTTYGTSPELVAGLRRIRIEIDSTLVGRAAREQRPLQIPDLDQADLDPHLRLMYDHGWRSVLVAPMLRRGQIIGALVIRRKSPHEFSPGTIDLLETLAGQSALAIYNAGLYRELEVKKDELQVASQHKSEFLASMSHELRTPLNAVIGFAEVLLERMFGDLNARQEEYLRDIWTSGRHLLELLNEILDLSKVEAGRMELAFSVFSVSDAIEYVISMVRERATAHGISLAMHVDDEVGLVEADELRFKQVLLNLVGNAVKFTPDRGRVSISATTVGDELLVSVTDNGPGIAAEDRERIFESFQQGGRGPASEDGTGLGLTLCRRIVELFGGRMWLDSELGRGSTFGFAISTARARRLSEPRVPSEKPRVVVIEDDRVAVDLFSAYLEGTGIDLVTTGDGAQGLALLRSSAADAVLLDIRLPGIDGWDVLREMKADSRTAGIPVIVLTVVDERSRGIELGAQDYLTKPVRRDQLLTALARAGVPTGASRAGRGEAS